MMKKSSKIIIYLIAFALTAIIAWFTYDYICNNTIPTPSLEEETVVTDSITTEVSNVDSLTVVESNNNNL